MRFFSSTAWWQQRVNDLRPKIILRRLTARLMSRNASKCQTIVFVLTTLLQLKSINSTSSTYSQRRPQTVDVGCPATMAIRVASLLEIIPCCFASMMCISSVVWVIWMKFAQSPNNIAVVLFVPRSFGRKHLLLWIFSPLMTHRDAKSHCQRWPHITKYHVILLPYCTHVGRVQLEHSLKKIATSSRVWRVIPPWFQGWAHHLSVQVSLKLGDAAGLGRQVEWFKLFTMISGSARIRDFIET